MRFLTYPLIATLLAQIAPDGKAPGTSPVSFQREVAPILVTHCLACHDDRNAEGGLNLATYAGLMKGGTTLPRESIVPGEPDASYVIELIQPDADPRMPFKQEPLGERDRSILARWVREGAVFDGPSETETRLSTLVDPFSNLPDVPVLIPAEEPITAVRFRPDGKLLAVGRGPDVLLFDLATKNVSASLSGHDGRVFDLAFTPNGLSLIVVGGQPGVAGSIAVWDVTERERRRTFTAHNDAILVADLSPDGAFLATAGYDRIARIHDLATGRVIGTFQEHTDAIFDVAFSSDGTRLATASGDRTIKLWDVASGTRLATLSQATGELYALTFDPAGGALIGGGADKNLRIWKLEKSGTRLERQAFGHDGPILSIRAMPDGRTLVSSGEDRAIRAWEMTTLAPLGVIAQFHDWPQTLDVSPDGRFLAVGVQDGSLALVDLQDPTKIHRLLEPTSRDLGEITRDPDVSLVSTAEPPKPELVRPPTLNPPSPRGSVRGGTARVSLTGQGIGSAQSVVFPDRTRSKGLTAQIVTPADAKPNEIQIDLTIAPDVPPGVHRFVVRTERGTPASQSFVVSADPEVWLDDATKGSEIARIVLPTTVVGQIDPPGDVDSATFEAVSGQEIVIQTLAKSFGSVLDPVVSILDARGETLVQARGNGRHPDPTLVFRPPSDGFYTLRIADAQFGGSGNHTYRIHIGRYPHVMSVSPLGLALGSTVDVSLAGPNLERVIGRACAQTQAVPSRLVPVEIVNDGQASRIEGRLVVASEGPQIVESGPNDSIENAGMIANPGGISGRIDNPGEVDFFRFQARAGERVVVETYAQRLGTLMDPMIEIFDDQGRPVPRALLRPVASTNVAFRDHASTGRNIRLTEWSDFRVGDYVLAGREVLRLAELPRNPDDDAIFWGQGIARLNMGERVAFLETTPEHHPMAQPMFKVEIHPPGAVLPPGGLPPTTVSYRNDDGGPNFQGDARVTFDPPSDGTYIVRVEDARGQGGANVAYHLVLRRPQPDFAVRLSTNTPHVPRGGASILTVNIDRIDGFDGPVDVMLEDLPPGLSATATRIEPGLLAADLLIMATEDAPDFIDEWTVNGRAVIDADESGTRETSRRIVFRKGEMGGWITVGGEPNVRIIPSTDYLTIRPGERVTMSLAVERRPPFEGRVPIDVRNLPLGVLVENIGLNGVLVTESQTEREVSLYAEPWVEPMTRSFFAVGRCETAGTQDSSPPITLVVESVHAPASLSASNATESRDATSPGVVSP